MLYTIAHVQLLKNEIRLRPGSNFAFDNCLRADVSYFLCCTRAAKEIGDVCTQANLIIAQNALALMTLMLVL